MTVALDQLPLKENTDFDDEADFLKSFDEIKQRGENQFDKLSDNRPNLAKRESASEPAEEEESHASLSSVSTTSLTQKNEDDNELSTPPHAVDDDDNHNVASVAIDKPYEFQYAITRYLQWFSKKCFGRHYKEDENSHATWIGFWALYNITFANSVLSPMRDAIALAVGVQHMPKLTVASTILTFCSSVIIGWLFEAPDPQRRKLWKRLGFTRGENQGTSLALFYRFFALSLCSYAVGFKIAHFDWGADESYIVQQLPSYSIEMMKWIISNLGRAMYVAFFLVVLLLKLHSLSLAWGVVTEAMEYEEVARKHGEGNRDSTQKRQTKNRLQRLSFVGLGGTIGGIIGSFIVSSLAHLLKLPGLILLSAIWLEISAELAIELGGIMQKQWIKQQQGLLQSSSDIVSLDSSMKRSVSLGSMKRIASGNSLSKGIKKSGSLADIAKQSSSSKNTLRGQQSKQEEANQSDSFTQRLFRGVRTILQSRLLMAIFTYNALYASTTVLLSFERAVLVVNRNTRNTTAEADTRFLAIINMASSVAVFAMQASGLGPLIAQKLGSARTLSLIPISRLGGVFALAWWHRLSNGQPPHLILFLTLDECTRVMNLAIAKPVRESLWRGLSNEARYEAKPIVDTLANRWGSGSAAVLVYTLNKILLFFQVRVGVDGKTRGVFGLPPVLFLCTLMAV